MRNVRTGGPFPESYELRLVPASGSVLPLNAPGRTRPHLLTDRCVLEESVKSEIPTHIQPLA